MLIFKNKEGRFHLREMEIEDTQGIKGYDGLIGRIVGWILHTFFNKALRIENSMGHSIYLNSRSTQSYCVRLYASQPLIYSSSMGSDLFKSDERFQLFVDQCIKDVKNSGKKLRKELLAEESLSEILKRAPSPLSNTAGSPIIIPFSQAPGKTLCLLKGNIADKEILRQVDVVVNAANAALKWGGGGTNQAFSKIIAREQWVSQASKWKEANSQELLAISQVCVFDKGTLNAEKERKGPLLMHVLGPDLRGSAKSADLLKTAKAQIHDAYMNIFQKCHERRASSVLLPIISGGIFAGPYANQPEWKEATSQALFEAMTKELGREGSTLIDFKVIDYMRYPLLNEE